MSDITSLASEKAWRRVVSRAREAGLVGFAGKAVAVLQFPAGAPDHVTALWSKLIAEASVAQLVKFNSNDGAVLVY